MIKHKDVLIAIAYGKPVQILKGEKWETIDDLLLVNPFSMSHWEWRVKPEVKQVDYQALIDSGLLILFYDTAGISKRDYVIGKLKACTDEYYEDDYGNHWNCICFKENLRQVVTDSQLQEINDAGFDYIDVHSFYEGASDGSDELYQVIKLTGVREGYTL